MLPPRQIIVQRPRDGRPGKDADPAVLREAVVREVRDAVAALPTGRDTTLPMVATFVRDDYSDQTQQVLMGPVDGPTQIVIDVVRDQFDRIDRVLISAAE